MAERELLDAEWARLKAAKDEFESEKRRFEAEKKDYARSGGVGIGGGAPGEYKLFVGNLNPSTTDDALTESFSKYGKVKECHILKDKDGKSKRSAFIKFGLKSEADKAISMVHDKISDEGQADAMVVRYARKRSEMFGARPGMPFGAPQAGFGAAGGQFGANAYGAQTGMQAAQLAAAAALSRGGGGYDQTGYGHGQATASPQGAYNPYADQSTQPGAYGAWGAAGGGGGARGPGRYTPY
eukprot:gb/GEZN01010585.1/.p1 GENE.gb/GEZN01010585.1/~~gb/GEZN01010585.1/.p1  ORF type:complete len:262 (-),score=40.64 gb/GEZN01010585.1/:442-1161(-)